MKNVPVSFNNPFLIFFPMGIEKKGRRFKVSLVLASKNEERYVKSFFKSLNKQTRKPDEVILVDSSTDRTAEIAKPYVDKLIKVKTTADRHSAGYQRNIGVKNSKGDIVVFTDLDAKLYPDWLENLVKKFENPDVKVVQGAIFFNSYDGSKDKGLFSTGLAEKGKYLNHCSAAFRREILEENPLADDIRWDDVELGYRLSKNYIIYGCREAKVYHYGPSFKERDMWKAALASNIGWIRILKRHPSFYWLARIWYNILNVLFVHNLKAFIYYSFAFFYAIFLEITKNTPKDMDW